MAFVAVGCFCFVGGAIAGGYGVLWLLSDLVPPQSF